MHETSIETSGQYGALAVHPDVVRSVAGRIARHDLERAAKRELAEMLGLLPHLHATEPVVLG